MGVCAKTGFCLCGFLLDWRAERLKWTLSKLFWELIMDILITGGTGYIGSQIARDLIKSGYGVTVLAREQMKGATRADRVRELQELGVRVMAADLSVPGDILRCLNPAEYQVIIQGVCSFLEPTASESLTIRAMQEVVAFAKQCNRIQQVIDLGNCLVLADAGRQAVPDEEFPCRPNTMHGRNKLLAERILQTSGLPWVILRIGQVYGGKGSSFDWVVLDGIRRSALPLPGSGNNRVGLVHVEDVSQATRLVIEQSHRDLVLNVSSADTEVTQGQVFDLVADSFGVARPRRIPRTIALAYAWFSEQSARLQKKEPELIPDMIRVLSGNWLLSIEKATRLLGYKPTYPYTLDGIRNAYAGVFAGQTALFTPAGQWREVRGNRSKQS
jgi:nucleoside-diphosphate-sugar epimerase